MAGMSSYKNMRLICSGGNEGKPEEGIAGGWRVGAGIVDTAQSLHGCPRDPAGITLLIRQVPALSGLGKVPMFSVNVL